MLQGHEEMQQQQKTVCGREILGGEKNISPRINVYQ